MSELSFGDEVVVSSGAPAHYRPGSKGWVVALAVPGRELITIEFEDGASIELPSELIESSTDAE
jgi:hypothetical protein